MTTNVRKPRSPSVQYLIDAGPSALTYFAAVIVSSLVTKQMDPGVLRLLVAALPLPAIIWMAWAELSRLRRRDELRQRIELEAMTVAFALSFGLVITLTFIDMNGAIKVPITFAALLMAACWGGAQMWVRMRYHYWWSESEKEQEP